MISSAGGTDQVNNQELTMLAILSSSSTRLRGEQSLVRWATPQLHDIDALAKMVDPGLRGMYPAKSLSRFADIIALCVQVISQIQRVHCSVHALTENLM